MGIDQDDIISAIGRVVVFGGGTHSSRSARISRRAITLREIFPRNSRL